MVKKTSRRRDVAILLIVVIFGAIAVIGLYQNMGSSYAPTAQEYFQVTEAGIDSGQVEDNGTLYIVTSIYVNFKAVKGDAHEVVVQSWGYSEPQLVGYMEKDQPQTISLISPQGVAIRKQPEGFLTSIRISSLEATGVVKFYLSE